MKYTCPVCGFGGLNEPPKSWSICPCCLTEFEYSDASWTHAELRQDWIDSGAEWGAIYIPKPFNWSPVSQLRSIGYECTELDRQKIAIHNQLFVNAMSYPEISIAGSYRGDFRVSNAKAQSTDFPKIGKLARGGKGFSQRVSPLIGRSVCLSF